ncbi:hypothetical protein C8R44DRAFT_819696 [Mycena epipterygia]|nr:hypothetical protein C8R44DRAFT_819696 [Mycena epipterygia]
MKPCPFSLFVVRCSMSVCFVRLVFKFQIDFPLSIYLCYSYHWRRGPCPVSFFFCVRLRLRFLLFLFPFRFQ